MEKNKYADKFAVTDEMKKKVLEELDLKRIKKSYKSKG